MDKLMQKTWAHQITLDTPSGTGYYKKANNYWQPEKIYIKVPVDEWWVESKYPFEIIQNHEEVLSEEAENDIKEMKEKTPGTYRMMQHMHSMNINAVYGAYGGRGGMTFNHPGMSYYMSSNKIYKYLGCAETRQKELLVEHYNHKLTKLSKKKKAEVETLTNIVKKFNLEIDEYIDTYPERYV